MTESTTVTNDQSLPPGMAAKAHAGAPSTQAPAPEPKLPPVPPIDPNNHVLFGNEKGGEQETTQPAKDGVPPELQKVKQSAPKITDAFSDMFEDVNTAPGAVFVQNICERSGVDLDRAFGKALDKGDASLLDEAYIREKCGTDAEAVIAQSKALFNYATTQVQQRVNSMYASVAGGNVEQGKAMLEQAAQYFNKAADQHEKAEISYLLDSGNPEFMQRAAKRVVEFARSKGALVQSNQAQLFQPGGERGLSADEYKKAIADPKLTDAQYEKLRRQRILGRNQGL